MSNDTIETDRIQKPSKLAIKFANIVFVLGILFLTFIIIYLLYSIYRNEKDYYIYYIFIGLIIITIFCFGLKLSGNKKIVLSNYILASFISIYSYEIYLNFTFNLRVLEGDPTKRAAKLNGINWDKRTMLEVVDSLRNYIEIDAVPVLGGQEFINTNGLKTKIGSIFPLSGISNKPTVYWNITGFFPPTIITDEYGYNNSKGLYIKNDVDIITLGSCLVEAASDHPYKGDIAYLLRERGFKAINLGKGGSDALLSLAQIKEYAEVLKPKVVLWFVNYTDIPGDESLQSPLLQRYLNDDSFTQNLFYRQSDIDSTLTNYIDHKLSKMHEGKDDNESKLIDSYRLIDNLKLGKIRSIFFSTIIKNSQNKHYTLVLSKAKQIVNNWGGKLYVVYHPHINRYQSEESRITYNNYRKNILKIATNLDIPFIDLYEDAFVHHPDPLSLFPYRVDGHYTKDANVLMTEAIINKLKEN